MRPLSLALALVPLALLTTNGRAGVGDPQVRTDHPWYPGELACSTFERLFATQAEVYRRVVGVEPRSDQEKAIASWLWRNVHYWHGEEGAQDLWGRGFRGGGDLRTREYWTGLFAHGFGLCGTTHAQWTAEIEALLGHGRGRDVGVDGHNSFEVFLTGGPHGKGKWALLDHDLSTIIFDGSGEALLSIPEVGDDLARLTDRAYRPEKQHGWLVSGLDADDGKVYGRYGVAEYLAGYAGPPPTVHPRRGESFKRFLKPGLDDGKTFVFWGRNDRADGIPGPERSRTWVNQPEAMHGSLVGSGYQPGRARFANAVYRYEPDFTTSDYREGVVEEDARHVVFEFASPYLIAATPPGDADWGIHDPGCRNGLVLRGRAACPVAVSTDGGFHWEQCGRFVDGMDLTDRVKGRGHYLLRFGAGAGELVGTGLTMVTTCQANASTMPRLKDGGSRVSFLASGRAVVSAGPELPHAKPRVVAGGFDTPKVTIELASPRREPVVAIHAAAHVLSSNPPDPGIRYQIEYSTDGGASWKSVVKDWTIARQGKEPTDFWSQSLCWGTVALPVATTAPVRVRFHNDGGKSYARCEVHLTYQVARSDPTEVTFNWSDDSGEHQAAHRFEASPSEKSEPSSWLIPTGRDVRTRWVEFKPIKGERGR